jgi:HK97 family phage major capsid protein
MQPSQKYKALIQERADLVKKAEGILAKDAPTPEEIAEAQAITTGANDKPGKLAAIDALLAQHAVLQEAERTAPAASTASSEVTPRVERDPKRGFRSIGEFARTVMRACPHEGGRIEVDPRLSLISVADGEGPSRIGAAPSDPMSENGSVGEGYLVPMEFRQEIWKLVFKPEGILEFLQPEPTNSNAVGFTKDETTPWGTAGVQAKWLDAGEQFTRSKQGTKAGTNKLYKLGAFVEAEEELLEDAPRLESRLTVAAAAAITWKAEEALFNGDGVGKPLGFSKSPALVSVAKKAGQAADTIVAENPLAMYARALNPELSKWFTTKAAITQFGVMTIGNQPIWTPPVSGMKEAPGGFLLGLPVGYSRHCEVLGDKGDIYLVDPTGYLLNIKTGGIRFASSIHLWFDFATTCFRWMFRIGGTPILSAAVTPAKGSDTESHFITLDARA